MMSDAIVPQSEQEVSANYESVIAKLLSDMQHIETQMNTDRIAINLLKAEMHSLREEGLRLASETQDVLSRLKRMVA